MGDLPYISYEQGEGMERVEGEGDEGVESGGGGWGGESGGGGR